MKLYSCFREKMSMDKADLVRVREGLKNKSLVTPFILHISYIGRVCPIFVKI